MKFHRNIQARLWIGGICAIAMAGCSSNPVSDAPRMFEYDNFKIYADSIVFNNTLFNTTIIPTDTFSDGNIRQTWILLDALEAGNNEYYTRLDGPDLIIALRRQLRNENLAMPYSWPMADNSALWVIKAYQAYCQTADNEWLKDAYRIGTETIDRQWAVNYCNAQELLRGTVELSGTAEAVYPSWMRPSDKLSTFHLSTNVLHVAALRTLSIMAETLGLEATRHRQLADSLTLSINRKFWSPATGTYAQCIYGMPYPVQYNAIDVVSNLLAITSGVAPYEASRYICMQLSENGYAITQSPPISPIIKWSSPTIAKIYWNESSNTMQVMVNGRLTQTLQSDISEYTATDTHNFATTLMVPVNRVGINGFSRVPHTTIPRNDIIEIEAENIGKPGTNQIKQRTMAKKFIELTPTKNTRLSFTLDEANQRDAFIELIYADGTSYRPWALRNVLVNGRYSGTIALPRLYAGPSTRGTSTKLQVTLNSGLNYIVIDTNQFLPLRGSLLLDKIRIIRL